MYWCDDVIDDDPKTKDYNPGTVKGQKLILIALQWNRRRFRKDRIKNYIYTIGDSRELVYKRFRASPAVMKMGVSIKRLMLFGNPMHRLAVSMERYAKYFLDAYNDDWLERNDYTLVNRK